MKVYIAGPFFNPVQVEMIERIETLCEMYNYDYYSPRLHSGSASLTPEERRDPAAWGPVLRSNITELYEADFVLAVFEYAMPKDAKLAVIHVEPFAQSGFPDFTLIKGNMELPDNGTVFECGYAYRSGTPIYGFHRTKQLASMNLMLSHTADGFITGYSNLERFLHQNSSGTFSIPYPNCVQSFSGEVE